MKDYQESTVEQLEMASDAPESPEVATDETSVQLLTAFGTALVNLQRDFDRLKDDLARLFRQTGHEGEWNKIINS